MLHTLSYPESWQVQIQNCNVLLSNAALPQMLILTHLVSLISHKTLNAVQFLKAVDWIGQLALGLNQHAFVTLQVYQESISSITWKYVSWSLTKTWHTSFLVPSPYLWLALGKLIQITHLVFWKLPIWNICESILLCCSHGKFAV